MAKFFRNFPSLLTAILMSVPVAFVLFHASRVDISIWQRMWETRIPHLLVSSLSLVVAVTIGALFFGIVLAFLIERTDLPCRQIFKPLFIAPLITPCYIIAICYINFFGINGLGERMFSLMGLSIRLPSLYGFWGAAAILTLGTFPYVYMIVGASLSRIDMRFLEAARCLGASRLKRLLKVTLPLLFPALSAGTILVALYVLSDFGVVHLLRYPTFVNTIYEQMSGSYNHSAASSLSTILIFVTLILFVSQEKFVKRKQYHSTKNRTNRRAIYKLGMLKWPMFMFSCMMICVSLLVPVGVLVYWVVRSYENPEQAALWGTPLQELLRSGFNSLSISVLVATAAIALSLPIVYWVVRRPRSKMGKVVGWMSQSGIVLPGVLIALGISLVLGQVAPRLSFSLTALFLAFLIHFFAQALQMVRAGLAQVSDKLEEGARMLGRSNFQTFWQVTRPLLTPSMIAAWILVFLSSMRELPASLLLRPAGFDPLTVKIWVAASEGFYEQAAAPALLVIILSLPLVGILTKNKYDY